METFIQIYKNYLLRKFIDNFTSDALLTKIYEGRGVIAINDYALEKIKEGMEKNE